jgi:hypothetical protein
VYIINFTYSSSYNISELINFEFEAVNFTIEAINIKIEFQFEIGNYLVFKYNYEFQIEIWLLNFY